MARTVVLATQGIEPAVGRYDYLIQGDPSVLGLTAAVGSVAVQVDSSPPFAQWQKNTAGDSGWALVVSSAGAGASSASGAFRVSAYNVPVDGSTDGVATLATLTGTTMPQSGGPYPVILGPSEVVKLASDVTLPATAQLQSTGGMIRPASGKKLVVNAQPIGAGKMFDHSAGGVVLSGRGMVSNPRWWGADPTGVASSHAAFNAAWGFLAADMVPGGGAPTGTWGGKVHFDAGTYLMDDYGLAFGNAYGNTIIEGEGPSTVLQSPTGRVIGVALEWKGTLTLYGGATYSASKVAVRDMRFKGTGSTDATTFILFDQCEEIVLENLYFQDNGIECIRNLSGTQVRKLNVHNCHAKNVCLGRGSAWMNLSAQSLTMTDCMVENAYIGAEVASSFMTIANCRFKDMVNWGVMFYSTWSGYLDPDNGYVEVDTYGGSINNCQFINVPNRAILIPDYTGHANADPVHTSPAFLGGNAGQIQIMNNLFDRCGSPIWGGAYGLGTVECAENLFEGQQDSGTGPQLIAVCPQGGIWDIHHNTWALGKGIQWTGLVGNMYTGRNADSIAVVSDNTVINRCSNGISFNLKENDTIKGTRFLDLDGSIATDGFGGPSGGSALYNFSDFVANTSIIDLHVAEWAWWDVNHCVSPYKTSTVLPVLNDTLPLTFTFKPGDVLVNRGNTANWFQKKCTVGGTTNPTALSITGAATSGTKTLTVSANTGLMQYGWLTFPGFPTVTNKHILGISGTTITVDANFEATVTGGATVSWATPVFVSDRDLNTMSIASQAAGDIPYMASSTAITRLARGADGTYVGYLSGVPAAIDAIARYDAGNSSTAKTLTRTPARQEQKCTLSAATPAITIDDTQIPSGGYLMVDFFQDGTGTRVPTWALTSAGTINWVGGVAPTLTTTASKADRIIWHNEGARITAWLALPNF